MSNSYKINSYEAINRCFTAGFNPHLAKFHRSMLTGVLYRIYCAISGIDYKARTKDSDQLSSICFSNLYKTLQTINTTPPAHDTKFKIYNDVKISLYIEFSDGKYKIISENTDYFTSKKVLLEFKNFAEEQVINLMDDLEFFTEGKTDIYGAIRTENLEATPETSTKPVDLVVAIGGSFSSMAQEKADQKKMLHSRLGKEIANNRRTLEDCTDEAILIENYIDNAIMVDGSVLVGLDATAILNLTLKQIQNKIAANPEIKKIGVIAWSQSCFLTPAIAKYFPDIEFHTILVDSMKGIKTNELHNNNALPKNVTRIDNYVQGGRLLGLDKSIMFPENYKTTSVNVYYEPANAHTASMANSLYFSRFVNPNQTTGERKTVSKTNNKNPKKPFANSHKLEIIKEICRK